MQNYNYDGGNQYRRSRSAASKSELRLKVILVAVLCLLAVALVILVIMLSGMKSDKSMFKPSDQTADFSVRTPGTLPADTVFSPVSEVSVPSFLTDTAPVTTNSPVTGPLSNPHEKYNYTNRVPASAKVGDDFFNDAVFLGDSRTKGMMLLGDIKCDWYAQESLHISNAATSNFISIDGNSYSIPDVLRMTPAKYNKIYIGLGVNDLGYSPSNFISYYKKFINTIREICPNADIYVMSIFPISKEHSDKNVYGATNENVAIFNKRLSDMAAEMQVFLLDIAEPLWSSSGALIDGTGSPDGVHLGTNGYAIECNYIRTHTVK